MTFCASVRGVIAGIEILRPLGKVLHPVGRSDPFAGLVVYPKRTIGGVTACKNRSSVLHGHTIDAGSSLGCEHEFISKRGGHLAMGRGTGKIFCAGRRTDQLVTVVGDRTHLSQRAIRGT